MSPISPCRPTCWRSSHGGELALARDEGGELASIVQTAKPNETCLPGRIIIF